MSTPLVLQMHAAAELFSKVERASRASPSAKENVCRRPKGSRRNHVRKYAARERYFWYRRQDCCGRDFSAEISEGVRGGQQKGKIDVLIFESLSLDRRIDRDAAGHIVISLEAGKHSDIRGGTKIVINPHRRIKIDLVGFVIGR